MPDGSVFGVQVYESPCMSAIQPSESFIRAGSLEMVATHKQWSRPAGGFPVSHS